MNVMYRYQEICDRGYLPPCSTKGGGEGTDLGETSTFTAA